MVAHVVGARLPRRHDASAACGHVVLADTSINEVDILIAGPEGIFLVELSRDAAQALASLHD